MSTRATALVLAVLLAAVGAAAERVTTLGGETVAADIRAIQEGVVHAADGRTWRLGDLRRIERPSRQVAAPSLPMRVRLHDGSAVRAQSVTVRDGTVTVRQGPRTLMQLSLDAVRVIAFANEPSAREAVEAQLDSDAPTDRLIVAHREDTVIVPGVLLGVDGKAVRFRWKGEDRAVALDRVRAIVLPAIRQPPDPDGRIRLQLLHGSTLWADRLELTDDRVVAHTLGGRVALPAGAIWRIEPRSPRLVFVSDLTPALSEQGSLVTFAAPWQRDRNVLGGPLRLPGHMPFEKGVGVHAPSRLVYGIGGAFQRFLVTIGIDNGTEGRGDCLFVVSADGGELARERMRGTDAPKDLSLDVAGAQRLTLAVETGEDLDLADRANWADARLIRPEGP